MTDTTGKNGTKGKTESARGGKDSQKLRNNADGGEDARRSSAGTRSQRVTLDREDSAPRNWVSAIGGILTQLIQDTEKQLGKSRECVAWYEAEIEEYEEKLQNLKRLQELQAQQELADLAEVADDDGEEYGDRESQGI